MQIGPFKGQPTKNWVNEMQNHVEARDTEHINLHLHNSKYVHVGIHLVFVSIQVVYSMYIFM